MQKTTFPIEILIGEDESNDGTREICMDYQRRYPGKIELFLRSRENVIYMDDKPTGRFNWLETMRSASGKYIALCDGDDYWTDENKLQKQIDFLESNEDYNICFHNAQKISHVQDQTQKHAIKEIPEELTFEDLLVENLIWTSSCVFRNKQFKKFPSFIYKTPMADRPLHLLNLKGGKKAKGLQEVMSVYRVHSGGRWSMTKLITKFKNREKTYDILLEEFPDYEPIIKRQQHINNYRLAYASRELDFKEYMIYSYKFMVSMKISAFDIRAYIILLGFLPGLLKIKEGQIKLFFQ